MKGFTQRELRAIVRARRALAALPASLRVYGLDSSLIVCKLGTSCQDAFAHVGWVTSVVSLEYAHDEHDYGRGEVARTGYVPYTITCIHCGAEAQQVGADLPKGWIWDYGGGVLPDYCCPACSPAGEAK